MKKESKEYWKYHLRGGKNYLGWGETDIEIRKRYEEHHKLGFNLFFSIWIAALGAIIATSTYENKIMLVSMGILSTFVIGMEYFTIIYHQETTRLIKIKKRRK